MSRSLNKVTLIGNLGSDPEVRDTPGGGRVAQFSLATTRTWNDQSGAKQEKTEWHRCLAWNSKGQQLADIVEQYVKKGAKLYVEGRIEYRQYQDTAGQAKFSTEINLRELILLGGDRPPTDADAPPAARTTAARPHGRGAGAQGTERGGARGPAPAAVPDAAEDDVDLPF